MILWWWRGNEKERKMGALMQSGLHVAIFLVVLVQWECTRLYSHSLRLSFSFQSELRVRHRDETKNVTRLTMENVRFLQTWLHLYRSHASFCTLMRHFAFSIFCIFKM
jgi:hypothetical protein